MPSFDKRLCLFRIRSGIRIPGWSACGLKNQIRIDQTLFRSHNIVYRQCCGSVGSVCFWASRIRIRHYLYGSGSRSFHQQAKKVRKTLIPVFLLLFDFLSLKTDVNVSSKSNKPKHFRKKLIYCWHLVSHWRGKQDPDPKLVVRIRIRTKMWRIHNTGYRIGGDEHKSRGWRRRQSAGLREQVGVCLPDWNHHLQHRYQ